jgi:hypothetical protein
VGSVGLSRRLRNGYSIYSLGWVVQRVHLLGDMSIQHVSRWKDYAKTKVLVHAEKSHQKLPLDSKKKILRRGFPGGKKNDDDHLSKSVKAYLITQIFSDITEEKSQLGIRVVEERRLTPDGIL